MVPSVVWRRDVLSRVSWSCWVDYRVPSATFDCGQLLEEVLSSIVDLRKT